MNEYKLLTPGPITTSDTVKQAMMVDHCTWDNDYNEVIMDIQSRILDIAHCDREIYTCVLMSGSGTYANEAVISTVLGQGDKLLLVESGVYGARLGILADYAGKTYTSYKLLYEKEQDIENIERILKEDSEISHIVMVHVESTFGFENDLTGISALAKKYGKSLIVDAMSSFGALDFNVQELGIDYLITTPNKALEAVPGLAIVICRNEDIEGCEGNAGTLSLNLYQQYLSMSKHKFRFTSPTHNVLALQQALHELEAEGGVSERHQRYLRINRMMADMMKKYKISRFRENEYQSVILNCFSLDGQPYEFEDLYNFFRANGYEMYPGRMTSENTFRIGNIGSISEADVEALDKLMAKFCSERNIL